jgi:hypothetical protein
MSSRFHLIPGSQKGNIAAFFILLLFSLSGLILQSGIWLLVVVLCCFGIVSVVSVGYVYYYYRKRVKETSS